jgi:hypothetical protein
MLSVLRMVLPTISCLSNDILFAELCTDIFFCAVKCHLLSLRGTKTMRVRLKVAQNVIVLVLASLAFQFIHHRKRCSGFVMSSAMLLAHTRTVLLAGH